MRERGDDALLLAQFYIDKTNQKRRGYTLKGLSPEVAQIFRHYRWSGNVRELRNVIERASILEDGDVVTTAHLPVDLLNTGMGHLAAPGILLPPGGIPLETVEAELAKQALARTGGNLTKAARLLNISRDQLRYKLKKSGDYETKQPLESS